MKQNQSQPTAEISIYLWLNLKYIIHPMETLTVACSLPFNSVADIRRWEGQTERCCRAQDDIAQLQRQTLEAITFVKGVRTQGDPASVLSEQRMTESDVDYDFTTRRECAAGYL